MLGARATLAELDGWDVVMDAAGLRHVGRAVVDDRVGHLGEQVTSALDALHAVRALDPDALALHVGYNGRIDEDDERALADALAGFPVAVLLTLREPREWKAPDNIRLRAIAERSPNVVLLDWERLSVGRDWITGDGFHLSRPGRKVYAALIAVTLAEAGVWSR